MAENGDEMILVITTFPEAEKAKEAARHLVEQKLAACCTLLPGTSVYSWQQKLCEDSETIMLIKTRRELYTILEKKLKEIHPYEVPEIIALPVVAVSQSYSDWVKEVTAS